MRLLTKVGLLVPLHKAYGYDPLNSDYSTRKSDGQRLNTIKKILAEAMREYRKMQGQKALLTAQIHLQAPQTLYNINLFSRPRPAGPEERGLFHRLCRRPAAPRLAPPIA